ncbi:MAG TPA: 2'-5' RNA ligase family protein [Turneriella sp.]|nr:2'-5' RNA ligase family protein [Turneriella sp.]
MRHKTLWFIAILPPDDVTQSVRTVQQEIADFYGPSRALKVPVHITVASPFRYGEDENATFTPLLESFFTNENTFSLELRNFGSFREDVIFIEVSPSLPLLEMHARLTTLLKENEIVVHDFRHGGFTPHATVANRDVDAHTHRTLWREFNTRKFYAKFIVADVALLRHDGNVWHVHQKFALKK